MRLIQESESKAARCPMQLPLRITLHSAVAARCNALRSDLIQAGTGGRMKGDWRLQKGAAAVCMDRRADSARVQSGRPCAEVGFETIPNSLLDMSALSKRSCAPWAVQQTLLAHPKSAEVCGWTLRSSCSDNQRMIRKAA